MGLDRSGLKTRPRRGKGGWLVYILRCRDGSLYTGVTNDLPARVDTHNRGRGAAYTRARRPVKVVYSEPCAGRGAALKREHAIRLLGRAGKRLLALAGKVPVRRR